MKITEILPTLTLVVMAGFGMTYTTLDIVEEVQQNDAPVVIMENTADNPADREPLNRLVADLKERGWTTNPADRCECIYPPE